MKRAPPGDELKERTGLTEAFLGALWVEQGLSENYLRDAGSALVGAK
jgi:hypothetical protein